jgi:TonB family protein
MSERVDCANFEGLAVLYAAGELEAPARAAIEAHAGVCSHCGAVLRRELQLAKILAAGGDATGPEPSDLLLASCRSDLSKALDAENARANGWRQWLRPRTWAAAVSLDFHPAWSIATLLVVGLVSGLAGFEGVGRVPLQQLSPAVMTVFAAPPPAVSSASPEAAPKAQAPGQNRPAIDGTAKNASTYDGGRNGFWAHAPLAFEPDAARNQERQAARIKRSGEMTPQFRRNAPPLRMPNSIYSAERRDTFSGSSFDALSRRMESLWWGGVRVDPAEQQRRLLQSIAPEYPEVARRAGIEGQVTLLLRIGTDGSVEDATLLSGEPILGRAAADAVEQWRYSPVQMDGEPVNVLTSVTFSFELQ